jgi:4,5-dihydroxyphthalate decarboxylase
MKENEHPMSNSAAAETPAHDRNAIELAGGDYEHVLGIGQAIDDIDIIYSVRPLNELFERMIADRAFEACEFSLANYLILRDRGADWLSAIPIFPYRAFRHSTLYVRGDSPFESPSDLIGKRIAVPDYSMTAAVWTRGILNDEYSVHWSSIRWISGARQRFPAPAGVDLTVSDENLEEAVIAGRVDALLTTSTIDETRPPRERKLRPLLRNPHEVEKSYYEKTGVYPINHTIVIRKDMLERLPALPGTLFRAYAEAKARAYRRRLGATMLPWGQSHWNNLFAEFGGDPIPYGLTPQNMTVIAKLAGYLEEQNLVANAVADIGSIFVQESHGWRA